ncbi:hypothetical protein [Pseudarthrobacter sp. efr-133-R2A-89]|uniref:hypothetical protein n=1 Tax=Pseudarthrobacter sp. efr-133-R2A-89 TaxID=3040302 RepID=UPI0025526A33|nr:hypothetical protein [Pseudarthrobacter sp. efr-133-R2A-89]
MARPGLLLVLITAAVSLPACGSAPSACPAIAQATAVSVTVSADYAPRVSRLHLRACQDGSCREGDLELRPGSASVDQGCAGAICSATASPDGTAVGMLMLETLTESPMAITASGAAPDGSALPVRTLELHPQAAYPFGKQCGKVVSASVTLDSSGLHPRT